MSRIAPIDRFHAHNTRPTPPPPPSSSPPPPSLTTTTMTTTTTTTLPLSSSPPPLYADCADFHSSSDGSDSGTLPCYYCSSPTTSFASFCPINCALPEKEHSSASSTSDSFECSGSGVSEKSKIFPSTRFFIAVLLCFCFISLSISTSNLSVSMVCMIRKTDSVVAMVNREFDDGILAYNYRAKRRENNAGESNNVPEDGFNHDNIDGDDVESLRQARNVVAESELRDLTAEIQRLKRSSIENADNMTASNTTSLWPLSTNGSQQVAPYINASSLFAQLLNALEEFGLDNATLQYKALRDDSSLSTDASRLNTSLNSSTTSIQVPVKLCQLARYRKHATMPNGDEDKPDIFRSTVDNNSTSAKHTPLQNRKRHSFVTVTIESCYEAGKLDWTSTDQGIVFAAQNAGSLLMLFTGTHADRLNSKWTIVVALLLLVVSNALLPILAYTSVWLVVIARVLTGFSDALLQPSTSSMITRWFPPKERPFAVGLITGGRQIGTLLILPVAGFLCSRHDIANGWPAIFYLSALIGSVILVVWLLMSADKPSKHFCTSHVERFYVEKKISEENLGKRTQRRAVPWRQIATCRPVYVGVAALICHEYPLVIMLQLLPKYINDVLKFSITTNGIVSALPIAVLFVSKTFSSSLSSLISSRKKGRFVIGRTALVKIFNAVGSLGLGVCIAIVPLLTSENQKVMAIVVLCLANGFAGLHTPGVQTALLQLAPAYTGIITGIAFGFVAIFSIINKVLSNYIVQSGSVSEWMTVFWIAAVVAILPISFFTLWGSAERQHWATNGNARSVSSKSSDSTSCPDLASNHSTHFINCVSTPTYERDRPNMLPNTITCHKKL